MSDNCDHNFGTFDDFGVKNDQKVSNNMILMSKYKGKHGGKKGQKIRAWVDPPPTFGQCPKENVFFELMSSLSRATAIGQSRTVAAKQGNYVGLTLQRALAWLAYTSWNKGKVDGGPKTKAQTRPGPILIPVSQLS